MPDILYSQVNPHRHISLNPASLYFQYGGNVYDGMKAYLGPDGKRACSVWT